MKLPRLFLLCACLSGAGLSAAPVAGAHEGHAHAPRMNSSPNPAPKSQGSTSKPDRPPGRTALAEADTSQRFCMKNQEGKLHCIPFGAH